MRILRSVLAVLAGAVVAGLVIRVVEAIGHRVYPLPEGIDLTDPRVLAALVEDSPPGALLFVILAWFVGSLVGGWIAALIAPASPVLHALFVGAAMMAGGVINMVMIPHPLWFWIPGVLVFLPAAWLGSRLAPSRTRG